MLTEASTHEQLSHVDAAWLRMDTPTNPMVITGVLWFEGAISFADITRIVQERLLPHPRFRQRVVDLKLPFVPPHWQDDDRFDLGAHLHHVRLPEPADQDAFAALVSDLAGSPLPRERPLWQAHVVDDAPGGTALVMRLHHCIGDGVALVKVLRSLGDRDTSSPTRVGLHAPPPAMSAADLAKRAAAQATTLGRLLLLPEDPATPFRGALGTQKRVAWTDPVPLGLVKRMADMLSGTVNDVLQACVAGSVRSYLLARDALPRGRELRTMVPVFLQDREGKGLGNHFGLVFLSLPICSPSPQERVREVKRRMDEIKGADDATVAFGVLDAIGIASQQLEHIALEVFTRKASMLTTNVPAPPEPLVIAGHRVSSLLVWAPVSGYLGVSFTLLSYAGHVRLGVMTDHLLVEDPKELTQGFDRELQALRQATCN